MMRPLLSIAAPTHARRYFSLGLFGIFLCYCCLSTNCSYRTGLELSGAIRQLAGKVTYFSLKSVNIFLLCNMEKLGWFGVSAFNFNCGTCGLIRIIRRLSTLLCWIFLLASRVTDQHSALYARLDIRAD